MDKVNVPRKETHFLDGHLQRNVDLGWSFEAVNVNIHGFLEALNVKDRSPEKFIDETNVKVSHEDGYYVLRNMTLPASNTMVRERFSNQQSLCGKAAA